MSATRAKQLGVDDAGYARMLEAQGGVCAICERPPKEGGRRLHVDHDHRDKNKRVRGLICFRCNRALPNYVDDVWLVKAARYVLPEDRHAERNWLYDYLVTYA